jgi:PatG C-terminal
MGAFHTITPIQALRRWNVMEQPEGKEVSTKASAGGNDPPASVASAARPAVSSLAPQPCPACGAVPAINGQVAAAPSYVYAIGRIEPRFPRISVEKELAQVTGHADTAGLSDRQALQRVLSEKQNRYLARQLCWVLTVEGLETYLLYPRDLSDLDLLIEAVRAAPSPMDLDVVIGTRGPIAPPELCNGLLVPIVAFDQIYSFDRDALIKGIPRPKKIPEQEFAPPAADLFDRIMLLTDNAGGSDEHRALNYLAVRYPAIYANAAEAFGRNSSLTAVETRSSPLSGTRKIVEVIFAYTNRSTDVTEKFFVRVDVTEEFPFLITKMSPYYDRFI